MFRVPSPIRLNPSIHEVSKVKDDSENVYSSPFTTVRPRRVTTVQAWPLPLQPRFWDRASDSQSSPS